MDISNYTETCLLCGSRTYVWSWIRFWLSSHIMEKNSTTAKCNNDKNIITPWHTSIQTIMLRLCY